MFKTPISFAVTLMGATAVVWLAACSSSSNVTRDAGPSGQNNPDGGGVAVVPCDPTVYCTNRSPALGLRTARAQAATVEAPLSRSAAARRPKRPSTT